MPEAVEGRKRDTSGDKPAKDLVTDEMKKKAAESRKKVNQAAKTKKDDTPAGVGVVRKRGSRPGQQPRTSRELIESDVPYPAEHHGEDFEYYGPHGFAAEIPEGVEITAMSEDQEFLINPDKVKHFWFSRPGQNLPKKRLYNVKALHQDGRLSQIPFEPQLNNTAGGDPEDAIGLRRYERKGLKVLIDWPTLRPLYCAAWDCWAQAAQDGEFTGFCTLRHAKHTMPNHFKDAGGMMSALGRDVTTSRVWGS